MKLIILFAIIALTFAAPAADKPSAAKPEQKVIGKRVDDDEDDPDKTATVVRSFSENEEDGSFKFGFESTNGIAREDKGTVVNAGEEDQVIEVISKYKYIDPNGNPVEGEVYVVDGEIHGRYLYTDANDKEVVVEYTAGKSGYVPSGNIIAKEITDYARNAVPIEELEKPTKGKASVKAERVGAAEVEVEPVKAQPPKRRN